MTQEIIEGNKLIAEFMGFPTTRKEIRFGSGKVDDVPRDLKYHTSWDWLMPVVEKISKIEFDREEQELPFGGTETVIHTHYPRTFGMIDREGNYMFRFNCGILHLAPTLIEAAWEAVVYFTKQTSQTPKQ